MLANRSLRPRQVLAFLSALPALVHASPASAQPDLPVAPEAPPPAPPPPPAPQPSLLPQLSTPELQPALAPQADDEAATWTAGYHNGNFFLRDKSDIFRLYIMGRVHADWLDQLGAGVGSPPAGQRHRGGLLSAARPSRTRRRVLRGVAVVGRGRVLFGDDD